MRDSLAHPSYPVVECGVLYSLTPGSSLGCREAYIVDVSDGGLAVRLDHPVELGIHIRVDLSSCVFEGIVSYCRRHGGGFDIGIKLRGRADCGRAGTLQA